MKKNLLFALLLLTATPLLHAQSDKWVLSTCYLNEYFTDINLNSTLEMSRSNAFNVSGYYALKQKNDIISIGGMTGLTFAINPFQSPATGRMSSKLLLQVPVFAMVRAGAMSTPYNEQRIGLGVGVGGSFTHCVYPGFYEGKFSMYRIDRVDPQVVAELVLRMGGGTVLVRAHFTPTVLNSNVHIKQYSSATPDAVTVSAGISNLGFGLGYGF